MQGLTKKEKIAIKTSGGKFWTRSLLPLSPKCLLSLDPRTASWWFRWCRQWSGSSWCWPGWKTASRGSDPDLLADGMRARLSSSSLSSWPFELGSFRSWPGERSRLTLSAAAPFSAAFSVGSSLPESWSESESASWRSSDILGIKLTINLVGKSRPNNHFPVILATINTTSSPILNLSHFKEQRFLNNIWSSYQLKVDFSIMDVGVEKGMTGWTDGLVESQSVISVASRAVSPGHQRQEPRWQGLDLTPRRPRLLVTLAWVHCRAILGQQMRVNCQSGQVNRMTQWAKAANGTSS